MNGAVHTWIAAYRAVQYTGQMDRLSRRAKWEAGGVGKAKHPVNHLIAREHTQLAVCVRGPWTSHQPRAQWEVLGNVGCLLCKPGAHL